MSAPNSVAIIPHGGEVAYKAKGQDYFSGVRRDYIGELPSNPKARILEIGCGAGETGLYALREGKCGTYCGVELCENVANLARGGISYVVVGNIEEVELPWPPGSFDTLILSEVLEHLVDPWSVLCKLRPLMKPGATIFASSPNISHYSVIRMLLRGEWRLADRGIMDRTHLRWFTPITYRELFESAGYRVDSAREVVPLGLKARLATACSLGRLRHLFIGQIDLRGHCE
ncbi:MAG TPA: class I SAM-dependent methyltransferase [Candidatus Acidoferrales bacterium]|nr:class I SAM-dependent methyltransferase [Candidatus Acidoferrales bacterium]